MPKVWSGGIHFNTHWLRTFFFQRKTSTKWRRGGRGTSLSLLFPGNGSPSSSLNSGAHLHFHSVLSKKVYSMGNCRSWQNRVEAISDSAMRSDRGHPTENDRALKINPVSIRLRLPGSILPHEVQPDTNYHKIKLRQFASAENNADYNGAFRDTTGRCSLCFNFL